LKTPKAEIDKNWNYKIKTKNYWFYDGMLGNKFIEKVRNRETKAYVMCCTFVQ